MFRELLLAIRETCTVAQLPRQRMSMGVLENPHHTDLLRRQSAPRGPFLPLYHVNARAMSDLIPGGGLVMDVGSLFGQYVSYLAHGRPDIRIRGLEHREAFVRMGNQTLAEEGLRARVALEVGEMTALRDHLPEQVELLSSLCAMHRLASREEIMRCLHVMAEARARHGCGIWIFDLARPRHPRTPARTVRIFFPAAPSLLRQDIEESFESAWSFAELSQMLDAAFPEPLYHACSSGLKLLQVHWLAPKGWTLSAASSNWKGAALPAWAIGPVNTLRRAFRSVPWDGAVPL